jgi:hypothetical protein
VTNAKRLQPAKHLGARTSTDDGITIEIRWSQMQNAPDPTCLSRVPNPNEIALIWHLLKQKEPRTSTEAGMQIALGHAKVENVCRGTYRTRDPNSK